MSSCVTYIPSLIYGGDRCSERKNVLREQGIKLEVTSEERPIPLQQKQQQQTPANANAADEEKKADREIVITTETVRDRQLEEEESSKSASPQLLNSVGAKDDISVLTAAKSAEEGRGEKQQVSTRLDKIKGNGKSKLCSGLFLVKSVLCKYS